MIHKNANLGNIPNVTVVDFGNGTVRVTSAHDSLGKNECLLFKSGEVSTIGQSNENPKTCNEFNPEMAIMFKNKRSFDVFYDYVLQIKNNFETAETLDND